MEHILSLSYGKDSLACLEACKLLGYPIDRVIHAEVWATDTIPAELPPMIEFKAKADRIIKERYCLTVEHVVATLGSKCNLSTLTYEQMFYQIPKRKTPTKEGQIRGFPISLIRGNWCTRLKLKAFLKAHVSGQTIRYSISA
jgi:hypothetical protein